MKLKTIKKQNNGRLCIVCGKNNPNGIKADFYELENNIVATKLKIPENLQSYPGRAHGGIISAILDEVIGRAIQIDSNRWGVTGELNVRFVKPVPLDTTLIAYGKITFDKGRIFKGTGIIEDEQGNVLAKGKATYINLPIDAISEQFNDNEWFYVDGNETFELNNINLLNE